MYQVVILKLAKRDITEAARWYNSKQSGLGKRFTRHIRHEIKFIRQNPEAFPVRYNKIHTSVLKVFPFMIHYSIDHDQKLIVISAVLHTSRNPDIWQSRDND